MPENAIKKKKNKKNVAHTHTHDNRSLYSRVHVWHAYVSVAAYSICLVICVYHSSFFFLFFSSFDSHDTDVKLVFA